MSNLYAHNGDEESLNIFAKLLTIQTWLIEGLKPLKSYDEIMKILDDCEKQVKSMIKDSLSDKKVAFGISGSSTSPNTKDSWKNIPKDVLSRAQEMLYNSIKRE